MTCNYCQKRCTSNHTCAPKAQFEKAVSWIAANDDTTETHLDVVAGQTTVQLVADIYGQTPKSVARLVLNKRA